MRWGWLGVLVVLAGCPASTPEAQTPTPAPSPTATPAPTPEPAPTPGKLPAAPERRADAPVALEDGDEAVLTALGDALAGAIAKGDAVTWPNLGAFSQRKHPSIDPPMPAFLLFDFKVDAGLQKALNPRKLVRPVPAGADLATLVPDGARVSALGRAVADGLGKGGVVVPGVGTFTLHVRPPAGEVGEIKVVGFLPEERLVDVLHAGQDQADLASQLAKDFYKRSAKK
jgi:hypothetical protein